MDIVEELRNNRENGAKRLEIEYKVGLMTMARRFYVDETDAEELVNRTFAAVVDGIDGYLARSAFFTWMCQIMSNIYAADVRRKSNSTVTYPGEVPDMTDEEGVSRIFDSIDASIVRTAVEKLPKEMREVILLHYFADMSIPQIAKFISIPAGTIKSRLHYARKALAAKLVGKAKKPGVKALILALALSALAAVGAVGVVAIRSAAAPETEEAEVVFNAKSTENTEGSLETNGDSPQQSEAITDNSEANNEENAMSNSMQKVSMIKTLAAAAALTAGAVLAADPGAIEVVARNFGTGEFTLRVPASEKPLELYWAAAWADDTADYAQWRAPVFLSNIPAGTTEVIVTVPGFNSDAASRFFLADPDNAVVTRPVTVIGGKDSSGHFNSAFVTGLHPNYDWKYDLVFDVPEFASDHQAWLLCHRNSNGNNNSLLHFIVRASNDKRVRFGHGSHHFIYSTPTIEAGVKYQAAINGRVCVVSNLADNVLFDTLTANASIQNYGEYWFWFGASSGANGKNYNTGDGCSFARVYSFRAWNGSGELVGDFRPMVTNSVAGYFDLVTRRFFQSGDGVTAGETHVFTPYVASAETQHVDSLVAHLGALVAVSPALEVGLVECVSESLPFVIGGIPLYGRKSVDVGGSVTFSVPTEKFIWWDEATRMSYRVASAGLRIDTYDANNDEFVVGTPQPGLRSYTFTRNSDTDGVRVVCLWDAEMLVDPPDGLRAECLRLVDVATNANGKTEVGHGPFNTGVHPIPATTRVFVDVGLDSNNRTAQNYLSPVTERRFFGCRDESAHGQDPGKWQYNFQLSRVWPNQSQPALRVDMCNYMDGVVSSAQTLNINNTARFEIDLNPTFTRLYDVLQGATHLAEMKDTGYERSDEPLNGTLHIFGQQRLHDTIAPLCVDYNNTRYYTYAVWTDGVNLSRDYAPCIDAEGKPAFYDRVGGNYIYPIGDKAEIVAEFTGTVGTNSVYVTGENEKGEPAAYLDPDATALGYHQIADGSSETFTATAREVFGKKATGYRVDTWVEGSGWRKGAVQSGRSVTLSGENSFRRVVWIWKRVSGSAIYII